MSKNTTIAAAIVAVIGMLAIAGVVIGINMQNTPVENETKAPTGHMLKYHGYADPEKQSAAVQMLMDALIPEEEQLTTLPQSFAPTSNYVEQGEIVYTGWKVDRSEPVVEEKPELEPIKPIFPWGCKHGYINPVFCPYC